MQKYTRRVRHSDRIKRWIELFVCIVLVGGLLLFSRSPAENVRNSLSLCYKTVIPAVFPFMVISAFLIRTGAHKALGLFLGRPVKAIFGCSDNSVSAVILGFLCGFPIGASSAVALYDGGEISKSELERLLIFINNPGAAFVIGGVGLSIFNSAEIGRILYFSVLISSIAAGVVSRLFYRRTETAPRFQSSVKNPKKAKLASAFTSAISDSAVNMLTVCACVVFFSVPVGIIAEILEPLGFSPTLRALLSSFFEISGGCGTSSEISSPINALMICAFACSWSGLSVHLQIFSVCRGRDLSFAPYLTSKLLQGLISPLLVFALSKGASELSFAGGTEVISASVLAQRLCFALFAVSILFLRKHRKSSTTS